MFMVKKIVILAAIVLLVIISIPITMAALQKNQTIHVTKTYTKPVPSLTPAPTNTSPTSTTTTPTTPTVDFSLFFPNGSAYVLNQEGSPSIFGATNLDTNGVPVNVQTGLGAPPMGYTSGVIVVRNDGNVPFTINATLANVNTPSDIVLTSTCSLVNPALYGSQLNGWVGKDNLAAGGVVGVGQYAWLSVGIIMSSTGNMGAVVNHDSFQYGFDVAVTATQA
jgi:hypothetical protein